jgi:hypothetical protein
MECFGSRNDLDLGEPVHNSKADPYEKHRSGEGDVGLFVGAAQEHVMSVVRRTLVDVEDL